MDNSRSKYHNWLKRILNDFAKENKDRLELNKKPIKITSSKRHSKYIIEYEPDFSFRFKTGKKSFEYVIFEFLDSQSYEGIFADIIECACINNCRLSLFLSKTIEKHEESINIRNIVCDFLDEIKGENVLDVVNLHFPIGMDEEQVKDEVYKEINKRIKLPKQPFILGKSRLGSPRNVLK